MNINLIPHIEDIDVDKEFKLLGYHKEKIDYGIKYCTQKINNERHCISIMCIENQYNIYSYLEIFDDYGRNLRSEEFGLTPFQLQLIWIKLYQMHVL